LAKRGTGQAKRGVEAVGPLPGHRLRGNHGDTGTIFKARNSLNKEAPTHGKKPFFVLVARDVFVGYRSSEAAGSWILRVCRGGEDWTERARTISMRRTERSRWTIGQAQDLARERARVEYYTTNLETRGRDPKNGLPVWAGTKLAHKVVTASSLPRGFARISQPAVGKGLKPATIDRINSQSKPHWDLAGDKDARVPTGSEEAGVAQRNPKRGAIKNGPREHMETARNLECCTTCTTKPAPVPHKSSGYEATMRKLISSTPGLGSAD
jgi:hypothetical protein